MAQSEDLMGGILIKGLCTRFGPGYGNNRSREAMGLNGGELVPLSLEG